MRFKDKLLFSSLCILGALISLLLVQVLSIHNEQLRQAEVIEEYQKAEEDCLVTALYHEARSEGTKGLHAVASVIYNRKNHPYFPDSFCGITNQYKQFSYTLENKPFGQDIKNVLPAAERKIYTEISILANSMVKESFKPTLAPSVMWYTTKKVSNKWTKKKRIVAEIGKHRFYADKEGKI
jgi:spore germination cell wall hydrolase CwlJ-like protein